MLSVLKTVYTFVILSSISQANASIIKSSVESKTEIEGVKLSDSIVLNFDKKDFNLNRVSEGIRKKSVALFFTPKIYSAELFLSASNEWTGDPGSLYSKHEPFALKLTFLRDLSSEKIKESFEGGLKINDVDLKDTSVVAMSEVISKMKEFKEGQSFYLIGAKHAKGSQVCLTGLTGFDTCVLGNEDFAKKFFLIWFGKTTDSELEKLKTQLLKPKKS